MSEAQLEECDALSAIYGDAYERLADTGDGLVQVRLVIESTLGDNDAASAVQIRLTLTLPSAYPSSADADALVRFSVRPVRGITVKQLEQLDLALRHCVAENAGQAALFSLASTAKEHVDAALSGEALPQFDVSALEVDHALSSTRISAAKQATKKLVGTPVTLESFAAWRAKFEAEMLAHNTDPTLGISLDPTVKKDAGRLSGREQFLLASAGSLKLDLGAADAAEEDDEDDEDGEDEDDDDEDDDGDAGDDDRVVVMSAVIDSSVFAAESTAELENLEFSDEE